MSLIETKCQILINSIVHALITIPERMEKYAARPSWQSLSIARRLELYGRPIVEEIQETAESVQRQALDLIADAEAHNTPCPQLHALALGGMKCFEDVEFARSFHPELQEIVWAATPTEAGQNEKPSELCKQTVTATAKFFGIPTSTLSGAIHHPDHKVNCEFDLDGNTPMVIWDSTFFEWKRTLRQSPKRTGGGVSESKPAKPASDDWPLYTCVTCRKQLRTAVGQPHCPDTDCEGAMIPQPNSAKHAV